jgi:hypothetical protein
MTTEPDAALVRQVLYALIAQVALDKPRPYWGARWTHDEDLDIDAWLHSLLDSNWHPPPSGLAQVTKILTDLSATGVIEPGALRDQLVALGWTPPDPA